MKRKVRFVMCKPKRRAGGYWYIRFYAMGKWPWKQAALWSIERPNMVEAYKQFKQFAADCEGRTA